jgi:hypothetical protein
MQAKFRGYFVPPRPEKNAVEGQRMSDNFVEERRASLQKYLQKLAAHPVIGPSEVRQGCYEDPPHAWCHVLFVRGICGCGLHPLH